MVSALSKRPANLGAASGKLAPCPASPNCVCSFAEDAQHAIEPFRFSGSAEQAMQALHDVVRDSPGATIVAFENGYLHAEFKSRLFRFVDDVEFLVDSGASVIHVRSASRIGYSDFGVNRKRVEQIRGKYAQVSNAILAGES